MSTIKEVIDRFPSELQNPMLEFWGVVKETLGIKKEDFTELKNIVFELAEAQRDLAQAQKRTELRVEELAEAQKRTEVKVEELAEAQKNTEISIKDLTRTIEFKIGGLGRKWGVDSERSFRNGLTTILSETGYEVFNYMVKDTEGFVFGHPSEIEIDVIVTGEKTLVVEIKASVSKSDVFIFLKKGEYYTKMTGKKVDGLIMIAPFVEDSAREVADKFTVTICDSVIDLGSVIQEVSE
ncbi:PD-(D/E)XK nuclease superfamily protein [anaerobic digester metagenome]